MNNFKEIKTIEYFNGKKFKCHIILEVTRPVTYEKREYVENGNEENSTKRGYWRFYKANREFCKYMNAKYYTNEPEQKTLF